MERVNGTKPNNIFVRDELDGVTKEMWEATRFPKISKKLRRKIKKLDIGKFIVYGTIDNTNVNTKP